ncbi:MAG: hypothetical protein KGH59_03800 [Candidatus Micrarchaeota archaeon]|nr:hypothetical protein [Candidatus Micrarchaeota archaeon]MDE1804877.1 hypothetical protein [Candidatus Micrarchaeota archaeon]MDE1847161.1 hypothetical protein [Candidatus Micrarchaeota archaeon]
MKVNIIEDEPKSLIVEFEGMDRAFAELIKYELLKSKDVEFASATKEHPELGWPRLIVKSSKSARALVLKAIEEAQEEMKEIKAQIPKK